FAGTIQVSPPDDRSDAVPATSEIDEIKQVPRVAAAFPSYGFAAKPGQVTTVSFGIPDEIIAGDPTENAWSALRTTYAQGHAIDADSQGEVVLGSTIDKELNKKIGDTIDLPVKPTDAKPDSVHHPFKV